VFDWIEDSDIGSLSQAADLLANPSVLDELRARAEIWTKSKTPVKADDFSVLAGAGIDLCGGYNACPSPTCMRAQVDALFRKVWHYFDRIVVRDVFTPTLLTQCDGPPEEVAGVLQTHIAPLLYLREIGASELVAFVPKRLCVEHWERHAEEAGLSRVIEAKDSINENLRQTGSFDLGEYEGKPLYSFNHSELPGRISLGFEKGLTEEKMQQMVLDTVFEQHLVDLTADVLASQDVGMPLGAALGLHGRMFSEIGPPTLADVVLQLDLPVLDGVPTSTLIQIRQEERDSFVRFRKALRVAIAERVKVSASKDAQSLGKEIRLDVIEPALSSIRQRLAVSVAALSKKSGVGLFLGALATTCGILSGMPPSASAAAGSTVAITVTGVAAQKHIDEQAQVALDDMYFLWRAAGHVDH
jgi:hypothetical protein